MKLIHPACLLLISLFSLTATAQDKPTGRYVQFSKAAKGSDGAIQIEAATFLGGQYNESLTGAHFQPNGDILAVGRLNPPGAKVLGADLEESETDLPTAFIRLSPDLQQIIGTSRLGTGTCTPFHTEVGEQGVYFAGAAGDLYDSLTSLAKVHKTVPNPATDARTMRTRHRFVAKLNHACTEIQWIVTFERLRVDFGLQDGGNVLVQAGRTFWKIAPDGLVSPGPVLPDSIKWRASIPVQTDPRDGSFYIGGEYHSSTGLEPWRCPTLYKLDKYGKPVWTAWNWTGPIVGVERFRLVSDSAVRQLKVAASGDLIVGGWSDGGNSCFLNQPYDLTIRRKASKFGDSTWGAGVLSVAHIMKLDSQTMELKGGCTWLSYNPTENKPNSCRINSLDELADGRVESWWTAYQRDPAQAKIKGGPYFAILSPDFNELLFSSVIPGVRDQVFAVRGNKVLIAGRARAREEGYDLNIPTFAVNALQPKYGGGDSDGYLMLVDAGK
jgi:hypothetical protein